MHLTFLVNLKEKASVNVSSKQNPIYLQTSMIHQEIWEKLLSDLSVPLTCTVNPVPPSQRLFHPLVIKRCKHQHQGPCNRLLISMCFQYACESAESPVKGEEMYFWQRCRHGAAVELFTLITFPLMPTACWNQRAPSGPKKPVMWPAFVVCWSSAWERQGQRERGRKIVTDFFFLLENVSVTTHLTCCLQK